MNCGALLRSTSRTQVLLRSRTILRDRQCSTDAAYFLDDHNDPGPPMPHNNVFQLIETLVRTIGDSHVAQFGHPRP